MTIKVTGDIAALDPIRRALVFRALRYSGKSSAYIAGRFKCHHTVVTDHLRMLRLPQRVQKQIAGARISCRCARQIVRLLDQPEFLNYAVDQVVKGRIGGRRLQSMIREHAALEKETKTQ